MKQRIVICPCCGQPFVLSNNDGVTVEAIADEQATAIAPEFGIELGASEGGEKIGD